MGVVYISKQLTCQKFIFKIRSSRLRDNRWKLELPVEEARRNDEVISLADSQILRWIDELNGITDADEKARAIKTRIRFLRKQEATRAVTREIRQLYRDLDTIQFKPDYMCLIIDKPKDYHRACRGFSINGIRYKRLLGTNGGIKNSTVVFVSERLAPELRRRVDNGRNMEVPLVTAKLEAYKALTCSASVPVSLPNGILVIDDAKTEFKSDVIYLTDEEDGEPVMENRADETIQMNASDGYGIMLPSLAERWSAELGLDYTVSGLNTRFSFEKGMVFTFDFLDFAEKMVGGYVVKDAWGNDVDLRTVELILTTSMVKLWDSYESCDAYVQTSVSNGYTFGIAKTCPRELESERNLNYQFIQSYELTDDDIDELIRPTMEEIRDVLGGDWRKSVLYLKGSGLNERNIAHAEDDYVKAIMIDQRVLNDPYVQSSIYQMIRNRINQAKVGVIKVHGNYSIVSGDPFLLCQSMFGLELTGLLGAGEIYNKFWADSGAEKLACFRAPMTCHNNIRLMTPVRRDDASYWYRYMTACTVFNAWDTTTAALNGCDYDGDLVMLTDNRILVEKLKPLPALMCVQRKAEKRISTEEDFIRSNLESFGNDIGQTTNWITSMYEVQAGYEPDSEEYRTLSYRICCGQLIQQNVIDSCKGIIAKPMPRSWHDRHAARNIEDRDACRLYRSIVASRKPYFMRYIYPDLANQYNTYIKNTDRQAMREFQMTVDELYGKDPDALTEREAEFLKYYEIEMPVGMNDCVMNKICRKFEDAFDKTDDRRAICGEFDYRILKSGASYSARQFAAVKKLYEEYNRKLQNYKILSYTERMTDEAAEEFVRMNGEFRRECEQICPNENSLCDITLDICYSRSSTKRFAWNMCGGVIIRNLLRANGNRISYPVARDGGEIAFGGRTFTIETMEMEAVE